MTSGSKLVTNVVLRPSETLLPRAKIVGQFIEQIPARGPERVANANENASAARAFGGDHVAKIRQTAPVPTRDRLCACALIG